MSEYTSAPWIIGDGFSVDGQYLILGNLDDEGGNAHTVVCDINEDPDEWHANARLIAAAPDLAEALEPVVREINPRMIHDMRDYELIVITLSVAEWRACAAALSKVSQQQGTPQAQGQQNEGAES